MPKNEMGREAKEAFVWNPPDKKGLTITTPDGRRLQFEDWLKEQRERS